MQACTPVMAVMFSVQIVESVMVGSHNSADNTVLVSSAGLCADPDTLLFFLFLIIDCYLDLL